MSFLLWWISWAPQVISNYSTSFNIEEKGTYNVCAYGKFENVSDSAVCSPFNFNQGNVNFTIRAYFVVRFSVDKI